MPQSPPAMAAARARYGLTSAPGMRLSTRRPAPLPTALNPQVRLSSPHTMAVGAHESGTYRRYEFTYGAKHQASWAAAKSWPATNWAPTVEYPDGESSPSGGAMSGVSLW